MLPAIQALMDEYQAEPRNLQPLEGALEIAIRQPEAVAELAGAFINEIPHGDAFLDPALSYLPLEDWPAVVRHALTTLEAGEANESAECVITGASLQCVSVLHPHLDQLFALCPNRGCIHENWPWRGSGTQEFAYLRRIIEDPAEAGARRWKAWEAMLETREPEVMLWAVRHAELAEPMHAVDVYLDGVGYEIVGNTIRRLYAAEVYHLTFPEPYLAAPSLTPHSRVHPTRHSRHGNALSMTFGGVGSGGCVACGGELHHLITLEPIPAGLGVTRLSRLELATCLSCLGLEVEELFYAHDEQGRPVGVGYAGPRIVPRFPGQPLQPTQAQLVEAAPRWRWQDGVLSHGHENLHRVGGYPCWIQNARYPLCPECGQKMGFLMQLDSELPTTDGGECTWGEYGLCYILWCDSCKVSGYLWQCS